MFIVTYCTGQYMNVHTVAMYTYMSVREDNYSSSATSSVQYVLECYCIILQSLRSRIFFPTFPTSLPPSALPSPGSHLPPFSQAGLEDTPFLVIRGLLWSWRIVLASLWFIAVKLRCSRPGAQSSFGAPTGVTSGIYGFSLPSSSSWAKFVCSGA